MLQKFAHSVFEGFVHCFEQIQLRTFNKQIPAVLFWKYAKISSYDISLQPHKQIV